MFRLFLLSASCLLMSACASTSLQTRELIESPPTAASSAVLKSVPFFGQSQNDCGPATLAMAMHVAEKKLLPAEIEPIIMAHSEQGTLPADIISFSRRQGLLAVAVNDMSDIVREIDNGYPVIVLQNLGFEFAPKWHYALVVGYDLEKQLLILHSGENEYTEMPMTYFERHWQFAKHWGLVILPPVQLSASGGEIKHLQAAVGLENAGQLDAASSAYLAIYKRWPKSLAALIGLGNVYYKGKKFDKSENYLEKALILDPQSKVAQHNLSLVRKKLFKR